MSGAQVTQSGLLQDASRPDAASFEAAFGLAAGFVRPEEVAGDPRLTLAEKRAVLASWASDARAVPDAPALRQLGNGAVVRVGDVLRMLESLDEALEAGRPAPRPRRAARLRVRLPFRPRSGTRHWSDDDDPPPCPAMAMRPFGGPPGGGEAVDAGLALAA